MPTLPSMSLSGTISPEEIYDGGLFDPKLSPQTLEMLNGGLDINNFGAPDHSIGPRMWQLGSFAMGYSSAFEATESLFARQVSSADNATSEKVIHASLTHRLFIPFAPKCLIFGYQAWFQQDATIWNVEDGPQDIERWVVRLYIDGVEQKHAEVQLPATRWSDKPADWVDGDLTGITHDDGSTVIDGKSYEARWRYASKSVTALSVSKGHHEFKVTMEAEISGPDVKREKCKSVIGSFQALAIR